MDGPAVGEPAAPSQDDGPVFPSLQTRKPEAASAWLWGNTTIANVKLNLISRHDQISTCRCVVSLPAPVLSDAIIEEDPQRPAKRICKPTQAQSSPAAEPPAGSSDTCVTAASQLPPTNSSYLLHDGIITCASGYFRALIAGSETTGMAGKGWCPVCKVATLTLSGPELAVAPFVLKFMYTLELLTDDESLPDGMQLVWIIQVGGFSYTLRYSLHSLLDTYVMHY